MKKLDINKFIGKTYNRLTILSEAEKRKHNRMILCKCLCGTIREYNMQKVLTSHTRSCGCYQIEMAKKASTTHGLDKTNEHKIWKDMKARCYNPNNKSYPRYGGRGITISDDWLVSSSNFIRDMGLRPSVLHTVERIDNNKPYCKENCKWATRAEQNRNTSQNVFLEYNNTRLCVTDWANKIGIKSSALRRRLQLGWSLERALTEPLRNNS